MSNDDRKVTRSSFFSLLASSIMETIGHVAGDTLDDLTARLDGAEKFWDAEWKQMVKVEEVGREPLLKVVRGKPIWIVHREGYQAWEGLCPHDGHFLDWMAEQDALRCVACDALFDLDGRPVPLDPGEPPKEMGDVPGDRPGPGEVAPEPVLTFRPLTLQDGYVFMEVSRHKQ